MSDASAAHSILSGASAESVDEFILIGGIDNVANEKPPILGDNQEQANTYPATYDYSVVLFS